MARVLKTIPWSYVTNKVNVATNTTFGTTTTLTLPAMDVELEVGRTVKAAWLEMSFQTQNTTALDLDGWEVGIDVNAGGITSQQYTSAVTDTGENEMHVLIHDVTAEFIADLDAGQTQSVEVYISAITEGASNVNCHTCTFYVTYECDNDDSVYFAYVDIPIQSHYNTITDTPWVEVGTSGVTGFLHAPPNQIPQLTGTGGWLSDSGIGFTAIHQIKLHLFARCGDNTANDQTLKVSLDAGSTSNSRATIEAALTNRVDYWDIVDLMGDDANMTLTTTAAAALHAANTTASASFGDLGGFVRVVYEIDPTTATRELHTTHLAMSESAGNNTIANSEIVDGATMSCTLDIQEPGPITMWQSAFIILPHSATNQNSQNQFQARRQQYETTGALTGRIWQAPNVASAGQRYWVQRANIQRSVWSLGVGRNPLFVEYSNQTQATPPTISAIVNYFSGVPAAGVGVGNRTVGWPIAEHAEGIAGNPNIYSSMAQVPDITDSEAASNAWVASSIMLEHHSRSNHNGNKVGFEFERMSGEDCGCGFVGFGVDGQPLVINETQHLCIRNELSTAFKSRGLDYVTKPTKKMDLMSTRRLASPSALTRGTHAVVWVTYHCVKSSVDILYTINGSPVTGASKVQLIAQECAELLHTQEVVGRPVDITLDGSGEATVTVMDRTVGYQALGLDTTRGLSAVLAPGTSGRTPRIVDRGANFAGASGVPTIISPMLALLPYDIVVVQITMGTGITTSLTTANGFALLEDQDSADCNQYLFWRRISETDVLPISMPVFSSFAGYFAGLSFVIRGCKRTGNPWNVVEDDNAASATAIALPSVTTTEDDCLVTGHLANGTDTATLQTVADAWTCAALVGGVREYGSVQTTSGGGGGCCFVGGIMPGQGATGTIGGAVLASASAQSRITVAWLPEVLSTGVLEIDANTGGGGGAHRPVGSAVVRRFS